jgi:hypothetical protein
LPRPRLVGWIVAVFVVAAFGATAFAFQINGPATAGRPAVRIDRGLGDVATVFDVQEIDPEAVAATFSVAEQIRAAAAPGRTASVGLQRLTRGASVVHAPPDGWLIPIVFLAIPRAAIAGIVGHNVSGMVDENWVMINELTAQLMGGAQAGDTLHLRAVDGSTQLFSIAGVLPYQQIGGTELLMTPEASARLGVVDDTQMVVWNIPSRSAFDAAVEQVGLTGRPNTRVNRSWDLRSPDDTLSTARAKAALGEPWYRVVSGDTIEMHPAWMQSNLPPSRILLSSSIPIRARCHVAVNGALGAALDEVAARGLGGHIDVGNTNTYGGCFNPRYSRISGFLSRHAYAIALDMNTTSNCQGCVPQMNCEVVRIFRKHGFAWGGNFRMPDGMHFEWVGEARDQLSYPSKYCPNVGASLTQSAVTDLDIGREVLTSVLDDSSLAHV